MNRAKFFTSIRGSRVIGRTLSQHQVDGIEALLDSCARNGVTDPHHIANILAQVARETGRRMYPVRETFADSDAQAIARLDRAFSKGQLTWVSSPYWRDGWFGRGFIQITHRDNYRKLGARLGVNLIGNPQRALDLATSADIAVIGMSEGMFTGRKLSDYDFPDALSLLPSRNPRRIVNGKDGSDAEVAASHAKFHTAIVAAVESTPGGIVRPTREKRGLLGILDRLFGAI